MTKREFNLEWKPPPWVDKPSSGLHLDVVKDVSLIQKLMIDEKGCYYFGRLHKFCDFITDHASCSRVHAALCWHRNLKRSFLVDLGSVHGTYIGRLKLEPFRCTPVALDSVIRFGASTRQYILREKPNNPQDEINSALLNSADTHSISLLGIPENETELDNLTEFNTASNKRAVPLQEIKETTAFKRKRLSTSSDDQSFKHSISFTEKDEIINPEDVDPSIGKYRNMIQSTVISKKFLRETNPLSLEKPKLMLNTALNHHHASYHGATGLYEDRAQHAYVPSSLQHKDKLQSHMFKAMGIILPNSAPNVDEAEDDGSGDIFAENPLAPSEDRQLHKGEEEFSLANKKKYAKEAWPGKKAQPTLLL